LKPNRNRFKRSILEINRPSKTIALTVDEFVDEIIHGMSLRERTGIANMEEDQWTLSDEPIVLFIAHRLKERPVFKKLMNDCIAKSGNDSLNELQAAAFIVKELWRKLRQTHKLRVVK
jgi:hypothetical protein